MSIGAPGELADGSRVQRIQGTLLTLTKPLLADMSNTNVLLQTFSQTGTAASGDYTVTLVDPTGVTVGASVFASAGLPAWPSGTHVTAISGNIVTLNVAFSAALSSAWIAFVTTNGVMTFAGNVVTVSAATTGTISSGAVVFGAFSQTTSAAVAKGAKIGRAHV